MVRTLLRILGDVRWLLIVTWLGMGSGSIVAAPPMKAIYPFDGSLINVLADAHPLPKPQSDSCLVLLFIGYDCPISNGYAPEMGRLCKEYMPQKIAFCVIYADADISEADARKHAQEYGFRCPALLDPKLTLARKYGATVKPEVVVVSAKGELLYRGRMDDRYVDFGKRRENVKHRELRDALEAVIAGKPVPIPRTQAIGCDIHFPQQSK